MKYPIWKDQLCAGCCNFIKTPSFMGGMVWACGLRVIPDGECYTTTGQTIDIINALCGAAEYRQRQWIESNPFAGHVPPVMDFMTTEERGQLHAAKLALPTFGEEQAAAKIRIQKRIEARKQKCKHS